MKNFPLTIPLSESKLKKSASRWLLLSTPCLIFNLAFLTPSLHRKAEASYTPHSSLSAFAQTPDPRKAEAGQLLEQGIQQCQTGQCEAALKSFEHALKIYLVLTEFVSSSTSVER